MQRFKCENIQNLTECINIAAHDVVTYTLEKYIEFLALVFKTYSLTCIVYHPLTIQ